MKRPFEATLLLFACLLASTAFTQQPGTRPELLPWHENFSIEKIALSANGQFLITIGDDRKAIISDLKRRTPLAILDGVADDFLEVAAHEPFFYTLATHRDSFYLQKRSLPSGTVARVTAFPAEMGSPALQLPTFGSSPVIAIEPDGSFSVCYEEKANRLNRQLVHFSDKGAIKETIAGIRAEQVHAITTIGQQHWVLTAKGLWREKNGMFEQVLSPGPDDHFANMQAHGDTLVLLSGFLQWLDTRTMVVREKTNVRAFFAEGETDMRNALVLRSHHPFAIDEEGAAWLVNTRRFDLQTGRSPRPYYVARIKQGKVTYPLAGPSSDMGGKYREVSPAFAYHSGAGLFAFIKSGGEGEVELAGKPGGHLFTMGRKHMPVEDIFLLADTGKILVRLNTYYSDGVVLDLSDGSMQTVSLRDDYHIQTSRFTGSAEFKPSPVSWQLYNPGRRTFSSTGVWQKGQELRINIPRKDSAHFYLKNGTVAKLDEAGSFRWFGRDNKVSTTLPLTDDEDKPVADGWVPDRFSYDSASSLLTLYWKARTTYASELVHVIHLQEKKLLQKRLARGFLILPGGREFVTGEGIFDLHDNRLLAAFPSGYAYGSRFMVSPNGRFICFVIENYTKEDEIVVWDRILKKLQVPGTQHSITKMAADPYSMLLFTTGRDQKIKVWHLEKGELVADIVFNAHRGDYRELDELQPSFLFMLPDGHYMGENRYYNMLAWRDGEKEYPVHQMDSRFHRPDKVLQALGYADSTLIQTLGRMAERRASRFRFSSEKADVATADKSVLPYTVSAGTLRFPVALPASAQGSMMVYVNGTALWSAPKTAQEIQKWNNQVEVTLVDENNHIRVCLVDREGKETAGDYFYVNASPSAKKDLFFVGIGVSAYKDPQYNLRYATKDMKDIYKYFMTTTSFENVYAYTAVDEKVSRNTLDSIRLFLNKAKANDQVIFYYAGHGMLDTATGNYYLSTHAWQTNQPGTTGISIDDLNRTVASCAARKKIMLVDACNSGLPDESRSMAIAEDTSAAVVARGFKVKAKAQDGSAVRFAFNHFNQGNGVDIMAAAAGNEFAYETDSLQNGLFTYSLLSALKSGDADRDKSNGIMVSEMQQYVSAMVKRLSRGRQQPSFRQANLYQDISLVATDDSYFAALLRGAQEDHVPVLKICIENEKVPVNKADEHGFTALHYASREGSLKAVKYLLGMGADVHLRTTYQFTPLYLAAINRHEAVVYQLIEKGAVSTQLTGWQLDTVKKRATPFTWLMLTDRQKMKAQETMQYQLIRFLANSQLSAADSMYAREKPDVNYWHYGEGINAAFATIFRNQQPGLQWLIDHGLDVNLTNAAIDGFTPLMAAAYIDNAEAAQLLLKHGANRLVRDRKGNTALDVARQNNSKAVMALLEQ